MTVLGAIKCRPPPQNRQPCNQNLILSDLVLGKTFRCPVIKFPDYA